jgi:hypothetical protein
VNPPGSGAQFPLLREGDNDFLALSPNVPIDAQQTVFATFVEVALPFVTRENSLPLLRALEVSLAGRYERFSIFGQATKPKAGLVWHPFSWLKLRSSIADSFRAPNLVQTNVAALKRQFSAADSYRSTVTNLPDDGSVQRTSFRQGNDNLQPEKSQTTSGGLVVEIPGVRGLSFTFDYFKINQNSVIQNRGAAATLSEDATLLQIATQAALAAGTPIDQIDLGSGTANYKGSNAVTRDPVTAEDRALFAAYNARQTSNATGARPSARSQRDRQLHQPRGCRHPGLRVRPPVPQSADALRPVLLQQRDDALPAPAFADQPVLAGAEQPRDERPHQVALQRQRVAGARARGPPAGSPATSAPTSTPGRKPRSRSTRRSARRTTSASSTTTASRATCCASIPRSATTRGSPIVSTKARTLGCAA